MKKLLWVVLLVSSIPVLTLSQKFQPDCALRGQIKGLAQTQSIDKTCPVAGKGSAASQAQNRAKNNFCASNVPVEVTIPTLRKLETKTETALTQAGVPFGHPTTIPPDRDILEQGFTIDGKKLKEGMAVFIRAFVLESHYSNTGGGEAVNCNISKKQNNDIHITLAASPDDGECEGLTAEISPHLRPTTWSDFDDYEFTHPVMFMGNLFYDASHKPCTPGHPVRPHRSASWEIHPIYSIFVCKNATLSACPSDPTDARWIRFDKWVDQPDDEEEGHHVMRRRDSRAFWAIKEFLYSSETRYFARPWYW